MVQQIKARMSKIEIGKGQNNKAKDFFFLGGNSIYWNMYKSSRWKNLSVFEKTK